MNRHNIIYENLRAEMARKNISIQDMSKEINLARTTLGNKLSGKSPIGLNEACNIKNAFFPGLNISYLFKEADSATQTQSGTTN